MNPTCRLLAALLVCASSSLFAANATPPVVAPPAPAPAVPAPPVAAPPAPLPATPPAAASEASKGVVTITLTNLNQIVGTVLERDENFLTVKTAQGAMKIRRDKVLREEPGGKEQTSPASGASSGGGTANTTPADPNAVVAATDPNSPDARVKAAKKKIKDSEKAVVSYQQAIAKQVGGVPPGMTPSQYGQVIQGLQNPQATNNGVPGPSANNQNYQPFATDDPKGNNPVFNPYAVGSDPNTKYQTYWNFGGNQQNQNGQPNQNNNPYNQYGNPYGTQGYGQQYPPATNNNGYYPLTH